MPVSLPVHRLWSTAVSLTLYSTTCCTPGCLYSFSLLCTWPDSNMVSHTFPRAHLWLCISSQWALARSQGQRGGQRKKHSKGSKKFTLWACLVSNEEYLPSSAPCEASPHNLSIIYIFLLSLCLEISLTLTAACSEVKDQVKDSREEAKERVSVKEARISSIDIPCSGLPGMEHWSFCRRGNESGRTH